MQEDFECQAMDSIIRAECALAASESVHREEFQKKIDEHQARYPGGKLPYELRDFTDLIRGHFGSRHSLAQAMWSRLLLLLSLW